MNEKIVILPQGEEKLQEAKKRQDQERQDRTNKYNQDIQETGTERERSKLERLTFRGRGSLEESSDNRYWALVNVESLREFVKYGANKVLDQIRIRTHANTVAREEIDKIKKQKEGVDAKQIAYTIMIIAVIGAMAWVVVSNFFNFNMVQNDNIALKQEIGTVKGQLAACQSELSAYRPGADEPPQTLEG